MLCHKRKTFNGDPRLILTTIAEDGGEGGLFAIPYNSLLITHFRPSLNPFRKIPKILLFNPDLKSSPFNF